MNDSTQQPNQPTEDNRHHNKRSRSPVWASFFSIVIAIIALAVAVYAYEQFRSIKDDNNSTKLAASTTSAQQQSLQQTVQSLQTRLEATQQFVSQLTRRMGDTKSQTTLSQIAYLINVATLQLNVSHNTRSALRMLQLAQAKIEDLNDPRLFALNKTVADDIQALKKVPKSNLTKIISEIDALSDDVGSASLVPNQKDLNKAEQKSAKDVSQPDTNKKDKWYKRAWHHISGIKDLIIIRKNNPHIRPLLDTQQQILIKSTIQSKLLLAEYAAIQHNNTLFQKHLATVEKWIKKYFFDSVDRENLLAELETIKDNNVSPKIPDINDTITVLDQTLNAITNNTTPTISTPKVNTTKRRVINKQKAAPKITMPQKEKTKQKTTMPSASNTAGVAI
jgi:uncharacterized protein HemX